MPWDYTATLANGTFRDAAELMRSLDEARSGLERVTEAEITFLTEGPGSGPRRLVMSPTAGHTHNGSDSRELAAAAQLFRGGLKTWRKTDSVEYQSWGSVGAAIDFNLGSGISNVLMARGMWRLLSRSLTGFNHEAFPPEERSAFSGALHSNPSGADNWYLVIDKTVSPNKVHIYNAIVGMVAGEFAEFRVWLLGI